MAAIAYPMADPWVAARPNRPDAQAFRRRRAVVLLTLAAVLLVAAAFVRLALAGSGGGALTTAGSSGAAASSSGGAAASTSSGAGARQSSGAGARQVSSGGATGGHTYVVQPGDTLWSIVLATGRYGDPRPEVDRLSDQLHGTALQPGQRLQLP